MKHVLVVDDAVTVRMYHRDLMEALSLSVDEAENGIEALDNHVRYIPEQVNILKISPNQILGEDIDEDIENNNVVPISEQFEESSLNTLLQMVEMQSQMIGLEASEDLQKGKVSSVCTLLDRVLPEAYKQTLKWSENRQNIETKSNKEEVQRFLASVVKQIRSRSE